jgi:hypothetical protein
MNIYIDNQEISIKKANYMQIDFGKLNPNVDYKKYRIVISINDFITKIKPKYDSFLEEYRQDDEIDNDFTPMYEGAENYPDFDLFMNLESDKKLQIISGYFIFIILDEFIEDYNPGNKEIYLLKNVENISINSDYVIFEGQSMFITD